MSVSNERFYEIPEWLKPDKADKQNKIFRVSQIIVERPDVAFFKIIEEINSTKYSAKKEASRDHIPRIVEKTQRKDHQCSEKQNGVDKKFLDQVHDHESSVKS